MPFTPRAPPNRRLQLTAFGAPDRWHFDNFCSASMAAEAQGVSPPRPRLYQPKFLSAWYNSTAELQLTLRSSRDYHPIDRSPLGWKGTAMHTTPASTRYLSSLIALLSVLLFGYAVLVLYPAYASGLAAAPDPTASDLVLPFYSEAAQSLAFGAAPDFRHVFASGFVALFWCVVPLCSLALLSAIVVPTRIASRIRRYQVTLVLCIYWSIILVTIPAANAFVLWLMD